MTQKTLRRIYPRFGAIAILCLCPFILPRTAEAQSSLPPHPPAVTTYYPLAEVHRGQHAVAYTVFEGTVPEPMDVEILGLLNDSLGPGQDMILARLHGPKPEYTGVVAGMSGSPVYLDGKLLGALSYRIGQFSKDPIAGITPIAQMLEVRDTPPPGASPNLTPIETPLTFSGVPQSTLDLFADRFHAEGLTPIASLGGSDATHPQPEPIVPGSAVSAIILRGDMSSAATCTVTYVDAKQLLACGHPFLGYGAVDFPMTKTDVVATLSSPLNSFKIVNTTDTIGAFTEDRSSAILGVFGRQARMIPIQVAVSGLGVAAHTFHYEVVDNPSLTPNALLVSVYQSLHGTNRAGEETSYHLTGMLTVQGQQPVHMDALLTPTETLSSAIAATLYVNTAFTRIYSNTVDKPILTGLSLSVEALPEHRSATLESATLSRSEAHPGDTLDILATLRPWQGPIRQLHLPLHLPESLPEGPLRIVVADAATLDRLTAPAASTRNLPGLPDTVSALNRRHPNDRLYAAILDRAPQAVLPAGPLPELPLSVASLLEPLKAEGRLQLTGESVLDTTSVPTGYALTGTEALTLIIR